MKNTVDIQVACENYQQTLWAKDFYPEDLPSDWKFDFYINEFQSLLLLDLASIKDLLANLEDSFSEDYVLICSLDDKMEIENFLLENVDEHETLQRDYVGDFVATKRERSTFFSLNKAVSSNNRLLIKIQAVQLLEPKILKTLADTCLEIAKDKDYEKIYLFFSDSRHSINNARNMLLLSQML